MLIETSQIRHLCENWELMNKLTHSAVDVRKQMRFRADKDICLSIHGDISTQANASLLEQQVFQVFILYKIHFPRP